MKVLLLGPYPPPHGGVQTNLVAIRSFLLAQGTPCSVINITRHRRPEAEQVYYPKGPLQLLRLLAHLEYDIIHLHIGGMLTHRLLALGLVCALRPGARSVLTFHSGGYPSTPQGQALRPSSFTGFVLRKFDGLIGVNQELIAFFQKLAVPPQRTRLISPYAYLTNEHDPAALPEPLAEFLANHSPLLISVGLLEPEYDLLLQIEAMQEIQREFPQAGLLLIGSGSLEQELRAKINAKSYAKNLYLAGDVPHAATLQAIGRASVLLRTTLYDGDAVSVREALQLGTPVIATDNGMRPEGVHLIPKSNLEALVGFIKRLLQQPSRPAPQPKSDESNLQAVVDFYRDLQGEKKI